MFASLISGLTAATFQSSRNSPVVRDRFVIVVMASTIISLNFSRNPVLQGSMMDIVGFIFLIMFNISSLSSGQNASKLVQSLQYVFCVLSLQNCSLIFLILLKKKSANLSGSADGGSICCNGFASFVFLVI